MKTSVVTRCLALCLILYAVSAVCGNKNIKLLSGQAAQPVSGEQKDQSTQFLETTASLFNIALYAKGKALDELEKKSKNKLWKKAPANKTEIDLFIQEHRASIIECQRLEPIYGAAIVTLATGQNEMAFWQEYTGLMEGLEGKK